MKLNSKRKGNNINSIESDKLSLTREIVERKIHTSINL